MNLKLTAGQRGDSPQFQPVPERINAPRLGPVRPRTRPVRVLTDKAYPSRANRAYLRSRGIQAAIPEKKDQRRNRIAKGRRGGRPRSSIARHTRNATPPSGPSAASSATAASRPETTSWPSATKPQTR